MVLINTKKINNFITFVSFMVLLSGFAGWQIGAGTV